jgi:hypothetical protein
MRCCLLMRCQLLRLAMQRVAMQPTERQIMHLYSKNSEMGKFHQRKIPSRKILPTNSIKEKTFEFFLKNTENEKDYI